MCSGISEETCAFKSNADILATSRLTINYCKVILKFDPFFFTYHVCTITAFSKIFKISKETAMWSTSIKAPLMGINSFKLLNILNILCHGSKLINEWWVVGRHMQYMYMLSTLVLTWICLFPIYISAFTSPFSRVCV